MVATVILSLDRNDISPDSSGTPITTIHFLVQSQRSCNRFWLPTLTSDLDFDNRTFKTIGKTEAGNKSFVDSKSEPELLAKISLVLYRYN